MQKRNFSHIEPDWAQLARMWAAQRGAIPIAPYPGGGGGPPLGTFILCFPG